MKNVFFVCLALILFSCGSSKEVVVDLNGEYKLLSIQGEDLSAQDYSFTFTPAEHRVTGETGCNGFSAKYTQENNVLSVGRAMSTRMSCEGKMDMAQKIISSLEDVARVEKKGNELVLSSTDNQNLFTLTKI